MAERSKKTDVVRVVCPKCRSTFDAKVAQPVFVRDVNERPLSPVSYKGKATLPRLTRFGRLLDHLGVSTYDLASVLGVTERAVRNWMDGLASPKSEAIWYRIAEYLNVPVELVRVTPEEREVAAKERARRSAEYRRRVARFWAKQGMI